MTDDKRYRIEGTVSLTPEEEEEEKRTPGRPNAWWAEHKHDVEEAQDRASTFDSAVRGVNQGPHGGQVTVPPEDVTGSIDYCWCGLPFDHDWPGKASGRKHPREMSEMPASAGTQQRIERRQLRAYNDDLVDVIIEAVNGYGARYRMQKNGVVLFPPDGTQGITLNARANANQVKSARLWFLRHCVGVGEDGKPTNPLVADTEVLAEDHDRRVERVKEEDRAEGREVLEEMKQGPTSSVTEPEEWVPYVHSGGEVSEWFETDGTIIRCKACIGKPTAYETTHDEVRGLGGHVRMAHRETDNLRTQEALDKSVDSRRFNRLQKRVDDAIALLGGAAGTSAEDAKKIKDLEEAVRVQTKRADDAEARLALFREALGTIEQV